MLILGLSLGAYSLWRFRQSAHSNEATPCTSQNTFDNAQMERALHETHGFETDLNPALTPGERSALVAQYGEFVSQQASEMQRSSTKGDSLMVSSLGGAVKSPYA